MKVDNAIIMAAGTSSRFAPLSYESHKAMTVVKGEVLIERQINQLRDAGVPKIYIITGYKKEQFDYLVKKYDVELIHNPDYLKRNNNGSIWVAKSVLANSYICSSDNYFSKNPFETDVDDAYYAAEYSEEPTNEWCITEDGNGYIDSVTIGGAKAWYMLGHTFWSREFSNIFVSILEKEYYNKETTGKLWEEIYMEHLDVLKMRIRKYEPGVIFEFDTMDELRRFDATYVTDTRSYLIKKVAGRIGSTEDRIVNITALKNETAEAIGFEFDCEKEHFKYTYSTGFLEKTIGV